MLATLLIVFRETIEAGLIVGIVLAATQGLPGRGRYVAGGVGAGLLGACGVALFAGAISDAFAGSGQEVLNASVLIVAVAMLGWHTAWMARHGRELAAQMRGVGQSVRDGERHASALAVVVGVAVLREGAEVVLFLAGIATAGHDGAGEMLAGGLAGVALGAGLSWLTHAGLVRLPARLLFGTIFWLVALLAAGMAAQAAQFLQAAGWIDVLGGTLWNSSAILPEGSVPGRLMHTLVGYTEQPSGLQALAYALTLAGIVALARIATPRPQRRLAAAE